MTSLSVQQARSVQSRNEDGRRLGRSPPLQSKEEKEQAARNAHADKEKERRDEEKEYINRQRVIVCGIRDCSCVKNRIHKAATERLYKIEEMKRLVYDLPQDTDPDNVVRVIEQIRQIFEDLETSNHKCQTPQLTTHVYL